MLPDNRPHRVAKQSLLGGKKLMCVTQRASQHVAARYYKLNRVTVPSELQKHIVSSVHHK